MKKREDNSKTPNVCIHGKRIRIIERMETSRQVVLGSKVMMLALEQVGTQSCASTASRNQGSGLDLARRGALL